MKYFDVIIIGSGIAGLNVALRFAEQKKSVVLVTKKTLSQSNSSKAQGGIAGVIAEEDTVEKHVADTMMAGAFHNKKSAVVTMISRSSAAIQRLIDFGVPFAQNNKTLELTQEAAHSAKRVAFVGDHTGMAIIDTLIKHVKKNKNITILDNAFVTDLLVKNKVCAGIQIIKKSKILNLYSSATVISTGGLGQLFSNTTNPTVATGDGIGMTYRAGCKFKDLEFIQFHPTVLALKGRPRFLISEALRGEGAKLLNSERKRFMKSYHELEELAPRDVVSRAIFEEEKKGDVYLDMSHEETTHLKKRFPTIYKTLKKYGLDLGKDLIPISPAAHYSCGGVVTNEQGLTDIKNLYAAGEVTYTGVHGANRLASNSLLEALVFSEIIAEQTIISRRKTNANFAVPKYTELNSEQKKEVNSIRKNLKKLMWENVGVERDNQGLLSAQKLVIALQKQLEKLPTYNISAIETKNMIQCSLLIIKAALKRKNSLGCHFLIRP